MDKPLIAVTKGFKGQWVSLLAIRYMLWRAGAKSVVVVPGGSVNIEGCHGIIILGGEDVSPKLYLDESPLDHAYDDARDELEYDIVNYAMKNKVPLLGICRGMQMINVAQGGSLYQEIEEVIEGFIPTTSILGKALVRRKIKINPDTLLHRVLNRNSCFVNSLHHQGIYRVGKNLVVSASEENTLIQALEADSKLNHPFFLGVQWHPELIPHHRTSRLLIRAFVESAKNAL